jgi:hypothetical protein
MLLIEGLAAVTAFPSFQLDSPLYRPRIRFALGFRDDPRADATGGMLRASARRPRLKVNPDAS